MSVQNKLPYYQIPEAPKEFTAGTSTSRMVDGLDITGQQKVYYMLH